MSSNPEQTLDEAPSDFLHSLVDAMRRVVEATRDRALAEMREAVETEAGQLDMTRSSREAALRERAEGETSSVGSWERAEIERIRADALRKVQARSGQLDQELAQLAASTTAEHAALAARADAYEREVSDFIEGLEGIHDPAAFAAAARNMPSPWAVVPRPSSAAASRTPSPSATYEVHAPEPTATEQPAPETTATEQPAVEAPASEAPASEQVATEPAAPEPPPVEQAQPATLPADMVARRIGDAPVGERNGVASATDASAADVAPAEPVAPEAVTPEPVAPEMVAPEPVAAEIVAPEPVAPEPVAPEPVADQATSIQVHGLGSFGAITSFKQSLERVDGIRSVTLGLGPSGEFVYTATHAPAFDLGSAIRAIEGEGVEIEHDNGTLRVKVGKAAKAG